MSNQDNTNQNPSDKPIQREELPKDEISYLYGFKMIIKHDKVGKFNSIEYCLVSL